MYDFNMAWWRGGSRKSKVTEKYLWRNSRPPAVLASQPNNSINPSHCCPNRKNTKRYLLIQKSHICIQTFFPPEMSPVQVREKAFKLILFLIRKFTLKLSSETDFPTNSNNCRAILFSRTSSWACWSQKTPDPFLPCFQWCIPAICSMKCQCLNKNFHL